MVHFSITLLGNAFKSEKRLEDSFVALCEYAPQSEGVKVQYKTRGYHFDKRFEAEKPGPRNWIIL